MSIEECWFEIGELYLFSANAPQCNSDDSLWGIFDGIENGRIKLEVISYDLDTFFCNRSLPSDYLYVRQAERNELRDFYFNLGFRALDKLS